LSTAAFTTLDLVRHGEIATCGLICASSAEPLSAKGKTQLETLKSGLKWDLIVSSPYKRCGDFAQELASSQGLPLIIDPAWQEMDFGAWTDVTRESIWASERQQLLQLWSDPMNFTAPGGESMIDFTSRIQTAFAKLLEVHAGKSIFMLSHAGVLRAILANALGIDYHSTQKFNVEHAKINRLRAYPDGEFSLLNWACTASELA